MESTVANLNSALVADAGPPPPQDPLQNDEVLEDANAANGPMPTTVSIASPRTHRHDDILINRLPIKMLTISATN
ncbi:Os03g0565000 [Oryza sativa Japonica Group]|uniref:Os03g0565000 protein n=1 Tax=Oryza sativa subsp. japonica TaxID=39947 RepID=A0A0P0VZD7_ORYSJ|nr:Os03g0565000 [Oryza sativa Japonica Group]